MITLTLPYPPTANNLKAAVGGRMVKTEKAKVYAETVGKLALIARVRPLLCDLEVRIDAFRPIKRGDAGNVEKAPLDSLKGFCYQDDSQIKRLVTNLYDDKSNPRIEVTVRPLADALAELERLHAQFGDVK